MNKLSLSQINEVLSRSAESTEIKIELSELQRISEEISNQALFEYIPIKIVACFESFFRELYKEIIDFYSSSLNKNFTISDFTCKRCSLHKNKSVFTTCKNHSKAQCKN